MIGKGLEDAPEPEAKPEKPDEPEFEPKQPGEPDKSESE